MIYTFHSFGGMSWLFSFILLLLFCGTANCYVMISGWLWFVITKKGSLKSAPVKLLLFPLLFSIFHSLIPTLFPWNMGYPWFWGGLWGAQTAELWGFRFLNTLFYVFNLLFLIVYHHFSRNHFRENQLYRGLPPQDSPSRKNGNLKEKSKIFSQRNLKKLFLSFTRIHLDKTGIKALIGFVSLFVFLNGLGLYLQQRLPEPDAHLNIILIQHNISLAQTDPKPFKTPPQKALYALRNLTYNSLKQMRKDKLKAEDIDFILWPEGAYPYTINKKQKRAGGLSKLVKILQIPLITGALSKNEDKYSNSLVVLDRKGNILQPIYDKIQLVIFGEYFPLIDQWPFLKKLFPYFGSNMTPGADTQAQQLESVKLGGQICYEALFDSLSRELANKQAQVIVNVTNDSWYGSWQEPYQHLAMSLARAIEIRRPVIRSTNTGYSGVVHADGTSGYFLHKKALANKKYSGPFSPINKAWFHRYKIPYYKNPPKTLFMSWGYYINEIFLSLLLVCVIVLSQLSKPHKL